MIKKREKQKNDYFREMLGEIISWGVKPRMVTGDSWYSQVENLKFLKNQKLGFLFGIEKNCLGLIILPHYPTSEN